MERKNISDILFSTVFAVLISLVCVVIFGLVAKAADFSDTVLKVGVIVIKLLSLTAGLFLGTKKPEKGLLKGLFVGVLYSIVCYLTFFLANGKSFSGVTVFDVLVPIAASAVLGVFVVNLKGQNRL